MCLLGSRSIRCHPSHRPEAPPRCTSFLPPAQVPWRPCHLQRDSGCRRGSGCDGDASRQRLWFPYYLLLRCSNPGCGRQCGGWRHLRPADSWHKQGGWRWGGSRKLCWAAATLASRPLLCCRCLRCCGGLSGSPTCQIRPYFHMHKPLTVVRLPPCIAPRSVCSRSLLASSNRPPATASQPAPPTPFARGATAHATSFAPPPRELRRLAVSQWQLCSKPVKSLCRQLGNREH